MSNTKLPPLDVIKEMAGEGVELPEEILDAVAGGAYSVEEWNQMSTEERQEAQRRSVLARLLDAPCELD